ncbi:MAG: SDR family oxidoreductase [Alphaproteobacteria bacterium]|nr:SDR family oxidoreductase [Alphaproteobacteria bacterium]MBU0799339.1 SDR family oxidoreductase [Alphaproteobacteria bacterium]MBU0888299.1 SDR family oxidoreductase [Alphaproteobacteria bacterium]MBU1812870.1 SDR family oxidoreductase [Alphaproteobacteria bacterium]MBU2091285.1 SDR family oxidoreductase [Alphaproteobacteria bacterium]
MAETSNPINGKTILITGAGSGIGRATAIALAGRGATVICAGRTEASLRDVAAACGGKAAVVTLDVTDPVSVSSLVDRLPAALRVIDVLINNAGHDAGGRQRFDQGRIEDWASIIDANVAGMMRVCHAILPGMVARGEGQVVNIGSVAAFRSYPGGSAYNTSKAAVHTFTEGLRLDYRDSDIRITEVMPGLTRTNFAATRFGGDSGKGAAYYNDAPMALEAEDIARGIVYALDQPPHCTVAQIVITPTREP